MLKRSLPFFVSAYVHFLCLRLCERFLFLPKLCITYLSMHAAIESWCHPSFPYVQFVNFYLLTIVIVTVPWSCLLRNHKRIFINLEFLPHTRSLHAQCRCDEIQDKQHIFMLLFVFYWIASKENIPGHHFNAIERSFSLCRIFSFSTQNHTKVSESIFETHIHFILRMSDERRRKITKNIYAVREKPIYLNSLFTK